MPNVFKFNTSTDEKSLRKGNFSIGIGDVSKGPSPQTGFYNGITPPQGGWTIYHRRGDTNNFGIYTASTLNLVSLTNGLDGKTFTQVWECLNYFSGTNSRLILNKDIDPIASDGVVFNIDFSSTLSYPTTSSTVYDISSSGNNTQITTGQTWVEKGSEYGGSFSGSLDFDGTDDRIDFTATGLTNTATVEMWCKIGSAYSGKMFMGWLYYDIWCSGGAIGFNTGNGDVYGISQATAGSLGIVDEWTHYIFEFRSDVSYTNNKIYINGVLQTLSQITGSENTTNRNFNSGNGRIGAWRASLDYFIPMRLSVFRVYNRSLAQAEVTSNYNSQKGRYVNFFTNGNFKFLDTSQRLINYTSASVSTSTKLEGYNYSLRMPQVFQSTYLSDGFVSVDTTKTYRFIVHTRTLTKGGPSDNILSGGHQGFACYDSSQRFIDIRNCGGIANTQLTRALVSGDSYAYVSDQNKTQWSATSSSSAFRHFCLYPPTHPEYNKGWEYTRIGSGDFNIYYNEITDLGGGELRFRFSDASGNPATFPNIGYPTPIGTRVMNGVAGGSYNYVFYPAEGAFGTWSRYASSSFTGESRNSATPFRFATKFIKYLHLINYSVSAGTTPLPVMLIGQATLEQLN
ncbi:LamG domain-containing protein [bacterium]|nr:LamG domain-containing protein [Candidatus Elulimicrobium humile]